MRDSIGSIYPVVIVLSFIILISGLLAFSVNYNKAFKMKNQIIYILEKYHNDPNNEEAQQEIKRYAQEIGYSASQEYTKGCNGVEWEKDGNSTGWCYRQVVSSNDSTYGDSTNGEVSEYITTYVNVETFVSIDVPIINKIFPNINLFTVTGSTRQITRLNE